MRHILVAVVTMALLLSPPLTADDGSTFAPHGLNPLHAEAEYPIPGGGRSLLFCGDKFISLLVVGILQQGTGPVFHLEEPDMWVIRKSEIDRLMLVLETGARIQFKEGTRLGSIFAVDTGTDARAILECLD